MPSAAWLQRLAGLVVAACRPLHSRLGLVMPRRFMKALHSRDRPQSATLCLSFCLAGAEPAPYLSSMMNSSSVTWACRSPSTAVFRGAAACYESFLGASGNRREGRLGCSSPMHIPLTTCASNSRQRRLVLVLQIRLHACWRLARYEAPHIQHVAGSVCSVRYTAQPQVQERRL
jgi:hypothetical protein